jgi:hypothetical protein
MKILFANHPAEIPALAKSATEPVSIVLRKGTYFLEKGIVLEAPPFPVSLSAEKGTRLLGALPVNGAAPVAAEIQKSRFPNASGQVFVARLPKNPNGFSSRGFGRSVTPSHSEAFFNQTPLTLAQYPRPGKFLQITGFGEVEKNEWGQETGALAGGFFYDDAHPRTWPLENDLWVHGFWSYDWANSYEKVTHLDAGKCFVETAPPHGNYQFRKGQRFAFINTAAGLAEQGDYYIDRQENTLYFLPPAGSDAENGELHVSFLTEPLLTLQNADHCKVSNLSFEACCGHGLRIEDGENIRVEACRFRNIGNFALYATGTQKLTVSGLTVNHTGDGGISVTAGDRVSLRSGETVIENNHLFDIAAWSRTYVCPINVAGVGFRIANNCIHDCPHMGIVFWGNDFTIENNEIYSVMLETGDAGAIYTGRDFTFRGNTVRRNFIHHLGGVGMGTMGIYNDDCVSGTRMEENVFFECFRAVFMGGGRDFVVKNNLFVDCHPAIEADGRGTSSHPVWRRMVDETMRERFYNIRNTADNKDDPASQTTAGNLPPYIEKYPELAEIDKTYQNKTPFYPGGIIENNLFYSKRKIEYTWDIEVHQFKESGSKDLAPGDFADFSHGIFDLPQDSGPVRLAEAGLTGEMRQSLPQVFSGLTEKDGKLTLSLRNLSDFPVAGEMAFFSLEGEAFSAVSFHLDANETAQFDAGRLPEGVFLLDGRSKTPGVRPCRLSLPKPEEKS